MHIDKLFYKGYYLLYKGKRKILLQWLQYSNIVI